MSYPAGSITLQLLRPDIRQSCILLAAVNSCASHNPTASKTTAIASPAIAGRRFSLGSRSFMAEPSFHSRAGSLAQPHSIQSTTAPVNGRPDALVKVIPRDLGYDLKPGD
jgi:hypothetical protein